MAEQTYGSPIGAFLRGFQGARDKALQQEQQAATNQLTEELRQIQLLNAQKQLAELNKTPGQKLAEQLNAAIAQQAITDRSLIPTPSGLEGQVIAEPQAIGFTANQLNAAQSQGNLNDILAQVNANKQPIQFATPAPGAPGFLISPAAATTEKVRLGAIENAKQDSAFNQIKRVEEFKQGLTPKTYTLSPGQTVVDSSGSVIASLPKDSSTERPIVVAPGSVVIGSDGTEIFKNDKGGSSKPLPTKIATQLSEGANAIDNLIKLKSYIDDPSVIANSGPVQGRNPIFGGANPFSETVGNFQGIRGTAKQNIGKFLEGGVLRLEDEKKYEKIIPSQTMLPAVQQNQAKELYQTLRKKYVRDLESYQKSGYDVSQYQDVVDALDRQFGNPSTPNSPASSPSGGKLKITEIP